MGGETAINFPNYCYMFKYLKNSAPICLYFYICVCTIIAVVNVEKDDVGI